ncbi:MAG: ABC transporter permease [Bacteroidetes bacterium]|nr:ABC transporter permease [Bacteroidota bacterium]MCL5026787.1 ABC transporter permease [Chloroflexota bacterium]
MSIYVETRRISGRRGLTAVALGMLDPEAIWMIWQRDLVRFLRQPARLYGSIVRSAVWLFALGLGLRQSFVPVPGMSYTEFIFPGVIAMALIFGSLQSAISVIWDREFGFLKEVMVAPIPRSSVLLGKALGGASTATLQGIVVLLFAPLAGVHLTPVSVVEGLALMFLTSIAMTTLGLVIAVRMTDFEGFGSLQNMVVMPMYLLSGAMFPTQGLPVWMNTFLAANPLSYGVSAVRGVLLGYYTHPLVLDVAVLGGFSLVMLSISLWLLEREG